MLLPPHQAARTGARALFVFHLESCRTKAQMQPTPKSQLRIYWKPAWKTPSTTHSTKEYRVKASLSQNSKTNDPDLSCENLRF